MHIQGRLRATWERHSFLRLFCALALIWSLLNLPLLLGIRVLPWDAMDEFYPTVYFNAHSLRMGLAPWWNPYIYSGYPQIADPQGMLFSPLLMAWMLLLQSPGATWFAWGVLLHMLMGATAVLAMLRRDGANAFGALIGASVFIAGGVAAARLEHTPDMLAYAYAPVALLALRHFLIVPGPGRGLLLGLAAGALATQLVQVTYLFVVMTIAYAVPAAALHWRGYDARARRQWCVGIVLAAGLACAIALPQLLFSWAFVSLSNRSTLPLEAAAIASLSPHSLLSLLDPNALHALRGTYSGPASRVEGYLYLGALPSLLLCCIGGAWRHPQQRRQWLFFAAVALFACLYMFGVNTPLYGWLYSWFPGMKHFRRPADAAYLFNFSFAILTGLAASHFKLRSRPYVSALLIVAACWLALASLHMRDTGIRWQTATALAAIVAVAGLCRLQMPGAMRHAAPWLLLVLIADYRCFNLNGTFNQAHDNGRRFMGNATADFIAKRLQANALTPSSRIETVDSPIAWDNDVSMRQIPSTQGYNPLRYSLYDQWYGARENGNESRIDTAFNPSPASKLSALLGVEYLIKGHLAGASAWSPPAGYQLIFRNEDGDVWRNSRAYPRLLTPTHAIPLAVGETPPLAAFAATDFHDTLWLTPRDESDRLASEASSPICSGAGRLQIVDTEATPTRLAIRTRVPDPSWLVLGDLDFPGWRADADGTALPIHRANGLFRAVCVPAGSHTVRFAFHPWLMVADAWKRSGP